MIATSLNPTHLLRFCLIPIPTASSVIMAVTGMESDEDKLARKMTRALALIPSTHKLPPRDGEVTDSKVAAHLRLQNWAFTQGFAVVLNHGETKAREQHVFLCTRHSKKTRDTRKNTEVTESGEVKDNRKRPNTHTNWNKCPYKIKLRYYKRAAEWRLTIIDDHHNHAMLNDPFQLPEHSPRNPNKYAATEQGRDLREAGVKFSTARRVIRTKGLSLSVSEYYNLVGKGRKRTSHKELLYALKTLENKGFSVRLREKYIIKNNVKKAQEVQFFFFTCPQQITITRQFASQFVIITDAIFNTNENRLPLSVIVCVTNILKSIPIAYAFIESESTEAFLFMNECMKDLFFYDNCQGPAVLLGDFAAGLTAVMVRKKTNLVTISEDRLGTYVIQAMQVA